MMIRLLLVITSVLITLATCEGLARMVEKSRATQYYAPSPMGPLQKALSQYRFSDTLGYDLVPGSTEVNSRGFHNPEYPQQKPAEALRIMLAGDSLAWAYGDTLRAILSSKYFFSQKLELWNTGVGGYNLGQTVERLLTQGMQYNPDVVVLFLCLNDIQPTMPTIMKTDQGFFTVKRFWAPQAQRMPLARIFWPHSALYRLLILRDLRRYNRQAPKAADPKTKELFAHIYLGKLEAELAKRGVPLLVFLFPYLMQEGQYTPAFQLQARLWDKVLQERKIEYGDVRTVLPNSLRQSMRIEPGDYIHMNQEWTNTAMQYVAQRIARQQSKNVP